MNPTSYLITCGLGFYFGLPYLIAYYQVFNRKFPVTIFQSLVKNRPENEKSLINTLTTFCLKYIRNNENNSLSFVLIVTMYIISYNVSYKNNRLITSILQAKITLS